MAKTITTKRTETQANHFINFSLNGQKVGYMVLDTRYNKDGEIEVDNTDIITECQNDPEYAQWLFGNENIRASYSQRGVVKTAQPRSLPKRPQ